VLIRGGFTGHEFHGAAQPQPKKSHHEDAKKSFAIPRVFVSSCLRGEQDACAPRRTHKNPCPRRAFRTSCPGTGFSSHG